MDRDIEIIIGGDICPSGSIGYLFQKGRANKIFNDLLPILQEADITAINLESPLIEQPSPIVKTGPVLGASSNCIAGIKNAGISLVNLANNHILDHGPKGLLNTMEVCQQAGLTTFGGGNNLKRAGEIAVKQVDDMKIGFMGMAEHEWSIAGNDKPGANQLDSIQYVRTIREKRKNIDYLIVLVHGGREGYPYPTPNLQNICRFFIEEGANAVIVQHSHCPGFYEKYNDSYIVYGQGNLIFEGKEPVPQGWSQGYLVKLSIGKNLSTKLRLFPYTQFDGHIGAKLMKPGQFQQMLANMADEAIKIEDSTYILKKWQEFCDLQEDSYLHSLRGYSRWFRFLNKKIDLTSQIHKSTHLKEILNYIRCESHRETLEQVIGNRIS